MCRSANKRRKIEREVSSEEHKEASFASFNVSDDQNKARVNGAGISERNRNLSGIREEESLDGFTEDEVHEEIDEDGQRKEETSISLGIQGRRVNKNSTSTSTQKRGMQKQISTQRDVHSSLYATGTFKSSMFKLQVDELLQHIRPRDSSKAVEAEAALHRVKSAIETMPPRAPLAVDDAERQLLMSSKISIPFPKPRPSKDAKYKLEYAKPVNVSVTGSYALKTRPRPKKAIEIDMAVSMPSSLFQKKDYLDHRFFYKRAYYLACIGDELQKSFAQDYQIRYQYFRDDPLKPFLIIAPKDVPDDSASKASTSRWQINILPCLAEDIFPGEKLLPSKSCIREQTSASTNGTVADESRAPTPFYNSSLRSDMLMASYSKLLQRARKASEAFQDACLLGHTWMLQRGFGSNVHSGGFGNFEWSILMALLLETGGSGGRPLLGNSYSSYQLLKATLQLLARTDFTKQPLILGSTVEALNSPNDDAPILWDSSRKHNILYKMTPWSYRLLRQEARTALTMLADQNLDGFDATFILRTDNVLFRYDYVLEMDASLIRGTERQSICDVLRTERKLYGILSQALGNRVNHININPQRSTSWELGSSTPSLSTKGKLVVGFIVNPDAVNRTIDHGPPPEEKKAAVAFRQFWGEKAELRRFKDGSIQESLIWSAKENGGSVLGQIVRYVIKRHLGDEAEEGMKFNGNGFTKMSAMSGGVDAFQPLTGAFQQLGTDIRGLDGLPISVRQIMPADAQLRYASTAVSPGERQSTPADVVVQFESSARWPDDLVAMQRTKVAFLLDLSEQMQGSLDQVTARVGLENEEHDTLNQGFLDIIYNSSAAFRLRIHHDREQTLLERRLKDKALDPRTKEVAAMGLAKYKRDYIKAPLHTQAMSGLCRRHAAMSGSIRLMKKWIASHLLSNHIADEVVELFVARTFTQPWPWQVPSSVQTGFLRTLFWISHWDWKMEPLIVDLSGSNELKQMDYQSINTKFEAWRKLDPAMNRVVIFVASNVDHEGTIWTDGRPSKVIVGRMIALARAACAKVEQKQLLLEPASLFTSSLDDFDFVIHLSPELVGKKLLGKQITQNGIAFKNLELDLLDDSSHLGFDPMHHFAHEIDVLYGSAMVLFSGGHERPVLAGLWSPSTATRCWKLNLDYSTIPLRKSNKSEVQAETNNEAILAEIATLGGDLVQDIMVHRR